MRFSPSFLQELRNRSSVSEVVGKRVQLHRKGKEFEACCPFHKEKTPSFTVNDAKSFYHCFGCGAHGDAIGFIKEYENINYVEAVERLAGEIGIAVPAPDPEAMRKAEKAASLQDVMALAARYYAEQLYGDGGSAAREYLRQRGLSKSTAEHFQLGYATEKRNGLYSFLQKHKITDAMMLEAGLTIAPDSGAHFDRFRHRVMFPITDRQGNVVAFGGRALGDAKAKYLNSPETPLFHKGFMLYNHHHALRAAHQANKLMIVEGYMDVIGLAQAGITYSVAPLGTAVTPEQIQQCWRITPEPIMCLDGDEAGKRAMLRTIERALPMLKPGYSLRFISLPAGEDPDSLVRKAGKQAMLKLIDNALLLSDALWDMHTSGEPLEKPEQYAALEATLLTASATIEDTNIRKHYEDYFRNRIWKHKRASTKSKAPKTTSNIAKLNAQSNKAVLPQHRLGMLICAILLSHPEFLEQSTVEDVFSDMQFGATTLDKLQQSILEAHSFGKFTESEMWKDRVSGSAVELVEWLAQQSTVQMTSFAQQDCPPDIAWEGWLKCIKEWQGLHSKTAQNEASERLQDELTEEAWQAFVTLKQNT